MFASRIMKLKPNSATKKQMTNAPHCCLKSSPILCFLPPYFKIWPKPGVIPYIGNEQLAILVLPMSFNKPRNQSGGVKEHDLEHLEF